MPAPLPADRLVPHPARLPRSHPLFEEILAHHARSVAAGEAWYVDPASGLLVQTAAALWARGTCCDEGCRHCPWAGGVGERGGPR